MQRDVPGPSLGQAVAALGDAVAASTSEDGHPQNARLSEVGDSAAAEIVLQFLLQADPDLASAAFLKLIGALRRRASEDIGREFAPIENAAAYLRSIIRSLRVDEARRTQKELPVETTPESPVGDLIAELDEDPSERIQSALRLAAAHGETRLVRFAAEWLDLANDLGRSPASREVADHLGVSHQTVINRLNTLRYYV